ncbi:MAG: coenzyme F430 synthase [Candidatus Methanomethylophilaceae archaeon]
MKILLLDTVHGGGVLGDLYPKKDDSVTCVDVYKVTPEEELLRLRNKGCSVCREVPPGEYDLVLMPVHCPDSFLEGVTYGERKFFSQAVGELIENNRFRIEVTGVKGKTSFCGLLAHVLTVAGNKVLLHSSKGRGFWENGKLSHGEKVSIAPPHMLTVPSEGYDIFICEVSLGGSGKADIACITNLLEDYPIAANTRKASDGKKEILSETNVVPSGEVDFWKTFGKGEVTGYGNRTKILNNPGLGESLRIRVDYGEGFEVSLRSGYLAREYVDAIEMTVTVCDLMNIPTEALKEALYTFKGMEGRGEVYRDNGRWVVKERNPGISLHSVERTYETLKGMNALNNAVAVLDPVSRKVCDKLDANAIIEISREYGVELIVTDGSGIMPDIPDTDGPLILFVKEGYT